MVWRNNEAGDPYCWVHPSWVGYERDLKAGRIKVQHTAEFTFFADPPSHGFRSVPPWLNGYRKPSIPVMRAGRGYEHPSGKKHYRDWCAGKITIQGLRVQIKTDDGRTLGPSKMVKKRIEPLPHVKIT